MVTSPKPSFGSQDLPYPVAINFSTTGFLESSQDEVEILPLGTKRLSRMDMLRSESPITSPVAGHFYSEDESFSSSRLRNGEAKVDESIARVSIDEEDSRPLRTIRVPSNEGLRKPDKAVGTTTDSEATRVMDNSTIATFEQHTIVSVNV